MGVKLLVTGGRDFGDYKKVAGKLSQIDPYVVITGGARGADTLAKKWAMSRGVSYVEIPAQWEAYGKAAGFIRNEAMLDIMDPDLVLVCPGGQGTKNMEESARKRGYKVVRLEP